MIILNFITQGCDKWLRLSGSIGAILFVISDGLIALSQFYMHIPNAQVINSYNILCCSFTFNVLDFFVTC